MPRMRRGLVTLALLALLTTALPTNSHAAREHSGFNDEYVFATTRSVSDMDVNPALKVTLIPVTIVLDTVFLPFAVIAGFVA